MDDNLFNIVLPSSVVMIACAFGLLWLLQVLGHYRYLEAHRAVRTLLVIAAWVLLALGFVGIVLSATHLGLLRWVVGILV